MDDIRITFLVLLYSVTANATVKEKRLVLHSDIDVALEINKLRADLNSQKADIDQLITNQTELKSKLAKKEAETLALHAKISALEQTIAKQPNNAAGMLLFVYCFF